MKTNMKIDIFIKVKIQVIISPLMETKLAYYFFGIRWYYQIMKNNTIGNNYWNTGGSNNWSNASLNTYLNNTYYNGLNSTSKKQIEKHKFSVGKVTTLNTNIQNQINDENSSTWNGKIGMITTSEYLRAILT